MLMKSVSQRDRGAVLRAPHPCNITVKMYNYCGEESATVTVEPPQDREDPRPHKPIPAPNE